MISKNIKPALSDAAQTILRPLVRVLLRNGVAYGAFADMARRVYVEIAEKEFALPGKKQTVSRMSTITGLTRKEVTRIQAAQTEKYAVDTERYNRPARVIGGWVRDKGYHDRRGRPADLPMEGETGSFSALVREFSGDIPTRAMADELARIGAIEILPSGNVRLLTRAYIPLGDQAEKVGILGADVADLIRTIDHNLTCAPGEAYFQRRVSYDNIPREMLRALTKKLTRRAQSCLESLDRTLVAADRDRSPGAKGTGRVRYRCRNLLLRGTYRMRKRLRSHMLSAITMCIAVLSVAGCAVGPGIEGGIVGTGKQLDCEPQTKKDGTQVPLPEECKPQSPARR